MKESDGSAFSQDNDKTKMERNPASRELRKLKKKRGRKIEIKSGKSKFTLRTQLQMEHCVCASETL